MLVNKKETLNIAYGFQKVSKHKHKMFIILFYYQNISENVKKRNKSLNGSSEHETHRFKRISSIVKIKPIHVYRTVAI